MLQVLLPRPAEEELPSGELLISANRNRGCIRRAKPLNACDPCTLASPPVIVSLVLRDTMENLSTQQLYGIRVYACLNATGNTGYAQRALTLSEDLMCRMRPDAMEFVGMVLRQAHAMGHLVSPYVWAILEV